MEDDYIMYAAFKCVEIFKFYAEKSDLCGEPQCVIEAWEIGHDLDSLGFPHCKSNDLK